MKNAWPITKFLAVAVVALATSAALAEDESPPPPAPERVISCAPHLTEIAFALGAGEQIIATDNYSNYPPEAAALPKVGGLIDPNLEEMLLLRPDALLLPPSQRDVRDFFQRRGSVRMIDCNDANSLASIRDTIRQLGEVFHRQDEATQLLKRLDGVFTRIEARANPPGTPAERKPSILILLARRPGTLNNLYAFHPGTFMGELTTRLGFRHVVPESMPLYPQVTLEHILSWNPDVILEVHGLNNLTPEGEARLREDWRGQRFLEAGQREGGVVILNDASLTIPGPRVAETFARLAVKLRPDVFPESAEELAQGAEQRSAQK
jgi:iron complex transport system substrate-binding protein